MLLESEKKGRDAAGAPTATAAAPPPPGTEGAATAAGGASAAGGGGDGDGKGKRKDKKEDGATHLRNFFLIVPALTINFVDNLRTSKDRMEKTVKGMEAFFSDDGFAMGIAYILAILRQDKAFESLHWWDAVARFHNAELAKCQAEMAGLGKTKADADRREELEFKRRRVLADRREFDSLFFAYRGARTFFRPQEEGRDDDEDDAIAAAM